jgi:D-tyrosyl-tRNA(Tyr) deacylase
LAKFNKLHGYSSIMRAVVQRVSEASVVIGKETKALIKDGLLILLGIVEEDTPADIEWLAGKIARLRIFNDDKGVMNLSVKEVDGEAIVVSQFTLHASTKKGNRPSYTRAARPELAIPLYNQFVSALELELGKEIGTGEFGAMMNVALVNDGPVTIIIDSKNKE